MEEHRLSLSGNQLYLLSLPAVPDASWFCSDLLTMDLLSESASSQNGSMPATPFFEKQITQPNKSVSFRILIYMSVMIKEVSKMQNCVVPLNNLLITDGLLPLIRQ